VVDLDAALGEEFFDIAIGETKAQVGGVRSSV
jgi:hypothetical protein